MAKVNFKQQKRQRELARKTRQEQKLLKRTAQPGAAVDAGNAGDSPAENPAATEGTTGPQTN